MAVDEEQTFQGGCHCGDVRFVVRATLTGVLRCNCSICTKKGYLHLIVDEAAFQLTTDEDKLALYTFGTHTAKHLFCRRCGVTSFYRPRSHPSSYSVNVRCLDGVDPERIETLPFDGQHWEEARERLRQEEAR